MNNATDDFSPYTAVRGMFALAGKDLVATVSALVFVIFLGRFLPNLADLGFVTGLQTLTAMFVILSSLGLPRSAARFIGSYIGKGQQADADALYKFIFKISIVSSIAFSGILYLTSSVIAEFLFQDLGYVPLLHLAAIDVFLASMIGSSTFLLISLQQFSQVSKTAIINSVIKFPAAIILLIIGLELRGVVIGLIIGDAITLILYLYSLLPNIRHNSSKIQARPLLRYSVPLYGSMILNFLSTRIDIYLLMILATLDEVGIYTPSVFVSMAFFIVLAALDQALLPYTSREYARSGYAALEQLLKTASRFLFLIYMPLGFMLAASLPAVIPAILGDRFVDAAMPASIIIVTISLTATGAIYNNVLRAAGRTDVLLIADSMALTTQISISLVTITSMGVLGAALARVLSRIVFFVYPLYKLNIIEGVKYDNLALKRGILLSLLISSTTFIPSVILPEPYNLPLAFGSSIMIYLIFLRSTRTFSLRDVKILDGILPRRLRWITIMVEKLILRQ